MYFTNLVRQHVAALRALLVFTVIFGFAYPIGIWLVAQLPGLQDKADGSLIAAAPNLLAAATHAMSWLEAMRDPASDPGMIARGELTVWAALRDAIAKAEGR